MTTANPDKHSREASPEKSLWQKSPWGHRRVMIDQVVACNLCHLLTDDQVRHDMWHRNIDPRAQIPAR